MLGLRVRTNDPRTTERSSVMRRYLVILGLLAFVASGVALASSEGKRAQVSNKVQAELQKIDARLKLSPDQKTQIKTLLSEQSEKMDALYAEIEPRESAIRTEYRGKIREVLTPAQQTEWDQIKGEYKAKWDGTKGAGNAKGAAKKTSSTTNTTNTTNTSTTTK